MSMCIILSSSVGLTCCSITLLSIFDTYSFIFIFHFTTYELIFLFIVIPLLFIFNHRLFLLLAKPFMVIALWFGKASFVHVRAPRGVCKQKNPPPITRKRAIILKWLVDFRSMMNVLDMWSSYFGSSITRFRLYMSYQTAVH